MVLPASSMARKGLLKHAVSNEALVVHAELAQITVPANWQLLYRQVRGP